MNIRVEKDGFKKHLVSEFNSVFEFLEHLKSAELHASAAKIRARREVCEMYGKPSWFGGVTHAEAVDLATNGWHDAPRLSNSELANNLANYAQGETLGTVASVSGAFLDIGAYCAGEPECFREFAPVETPRGIVLGMNIGGLSDVTHEQMVNRGVVTVAIIEALQKAGFTVSVIAFHSSESTDLSNYKQTLLIPIKKAGERVDENLIAYWACHASALRHMSFANQETFTDKGFLNAFVNSPGGGRTNQPAHIDGIDYLFTAKELPRNDDETFEFFKKCLADIEQILKPS